MRPPSAKPIRCPGHAKSLCLLVNHDDERDVANIAGAEKALEVARARKWAVAGVQRDWKAVFPE